ncbi:hypothetical protein C0Z18_06810 [Trinickia dabaoshanensis]|uniref:YncE family protein n=1 Tax=Trinickia dabaoshanensis TaxID=564714 RepID=A0A2N7VWN5_9BURK|nr:hypothetical protein [Trinickia dabaoshanensis]PMS21570.1 hypothetical protein C0Z18_06810 [Trinickia dabaoshanensis]
MSNVPADGHPHLPTLIGRSTAWSPQYSGDFDHFGVDTKRNRLLLAAEDHGTVEVFNLDTGAHERTLTTFGTPHAILYLPKQDKFVITDSSTSGTKIIDAATFKVTGHIHLAPGADSMAFDETTDRLYIVSGGKDAGMTHCFINEVDPATGTVRRRLRVDADHVEAMVPEMHGGRLFVNIASKNQVAVVDKKSLEVIAHWPLDGASRNLTMALDEAHHRLFVGTRNPSKLFVMNTDNGKTVAMLDAPASSDSLFYDGARKRIYVAGGDGYMGVYRQDDADHYTDLGRVATAPGAKSGMLSTTLDRIYLAVSPGDHSPGGGIMWFAVNP